MNDNKIIRIVSLFIGISLTLGIYLFLNIPLDSKIKNKNWYAYDVKTGFFDIFYINNNIKYQTNNSSNDCTKYNYNSKTKNINLNCDLKIKIKRIREKYIILNVNKEDKIFYSSPEVAINIEFKEHYNCSIAEYINSKKQLLEVIEVPINKIVEIYNKKEKQIYIMKSDNCNNIECIILYDLVEKLFVNFKNVYYINTTDIEDETIKKLYDINNGFPLKKDKYVSEKPNILIINDEKITHIKFESEGFNYSKCYEKIKNK